VEKVFAKAHKGEGKLLEVGKWRKCLPKPTKGKVSCWK